MCYNSHSHAHHGAHEAPPQAVQESPVVEDRSRGAGRAGHPPRRAAAEVARGGVEARTHVAHAQVTGDEAQELAALGGGSILVVVLL